MRQHKSVALPTFARLGLCEIAPKPTSPAQNTLAVRGWRLSTCGVVSSLTFILKQARGPRAICLPYSSDRYYYLWVQRVGSCVGPDSFPNRARSCPHDVPSSAVICKAGKKKKEKKKSVRLSFPAHLSLFPSPLSRDRCSPVASWAGTPAERKFVGRVAGA
ncbi:hypothetical protein M9X92_007298 [Pyricularia oryzae]|nr:hypothetical protein M9X92_007298 [Pyricularia oryzae]